LSALLDLDDDAADPVIQWSFRGEPIDITLMVAADQVHLLSSQ